MKTKLDCVAMKHQGAEKVREKISGLAISEELKFWQERSMALRKLKEEIAKKYNLLEAKA
ncbi:MAG: hypothetical protein ONB46_21825 [candidate division KSB1 bacterium]|nr:hypothetical protein [candidate division KSB1 bacterium]MDZ7368515.1 hypothetical protein [candidate division KSB1 bacterium]MDZ7406257.1 hypothetical protein [candidate division KSB1 bacterium]